MKKYEDKTAVDFVIVGAGGAGGVVAKELSTAGFEVVVLEQGPYFHESDFSHDELKFKDIFDPPAIGREVITNDHSLQPNTFRKTADQKAKVTAFAQYGRCVGGGTVQFTGNYWRFHEIDFHEASRVGNDRRRRIGGLADHLRRSRALLHKGRVGVRRLRRRRCESF